MSLVWLFREHRDAVSRAVAAEHEAEILAERNTRLLEDNSKLSDAYLKLQEHVQSNPAQLTGMMDLFSRYQQSVLAEEPFPDGKIPDSAWLTPETVFPVKDGDG